jgi:hypothetical protein
MQFPSNATLQKGAISLVAGVLLGAAFYYTKTWFTRKQSSPSSSDTTATENQVSE